MFTTLPGTPLTYFSGLQAYSPATQFAAGGLGLWYDQSDVPTQFQDTAGSTPITASGQTVGRINDKSGRNNFATQATAAARPIYTLASGIHYNAYDGIDDGMATGAITLGADMDCFIAVRRNTTANAIMGVGSGTFFGAMSTAGAGVSYSGAGTPTYLVNGVAVAGGTATTEAQLAAAVTVGAWVVLEVRNLNLSGAGWPAFTLFNLGGYQLNGDIGGMIVCPAGDATTRTNNRRYLGAKVGLSL